MPRLVVRITGMLPAAAASAAIETGTARADAMRDALQQESLDREDAERQDDQDQQRKAPCIDPEKQAADGVVAVGLDREVLADQFADREADQHRQQFDAAERAMIAAATANGRTSGASRMSVTALIAAI